MGSKKIHHLYLLSLYAKVSEYLSGSDSESFSLPEAIVSFCITVEKILKIRLYKKNPVLVFELAKFKDNASALAALIKRREMNVDTIKILEVLNRYKFVFEKDFTEDEIQILSDLFMIRNDLVHGHSDGKEQILDAEDLQKKMGTIWEKISKQAIGLFGADAIKKSKPRKKYTAAELEKVLLEEVSKKIKSHGYSSFSVYPSVMVGNYADVAGVRNPLDYGTTLSSVNFAVDPYHSGDRCPRCSAYSFTLGQHRPPQANFSLSLWLDDGGFSSNLYTCGFCGLELTEKEYQLAKRIT